MASTLLRRLLIVRRRRLPAPHINRYVGDYVTDLWESDHAATDARYNGTCDTAGTCTCTSNTSTASNDCRYSSYLYTSKAVALIKAAATGVPPVAGGGAAAQSEAPPHFFYFATQSVHSPYEISKEYLDRFPRLPITGVARRMHAMVAALDDFVGNVTQTLKDTGMWGNTLVILHADNGAVQASRQSPPPPPPPNHPSPHPLK